MENADELYETKRIILDHIEILSLEYENIQKSLKEEFKFWHSVIIKQAILSTRFDEFHTIWKEKSDQTADPASERAAALRAVRQEAEDIDHILKTCEGETKGVQNQLQDLNDKLKLEVDNLQMEQIKCLNATSAEQLQDFDPLEFENYQTLFATMTELNRKWDEEELTAKVNQCLEALREI